MRQLTLLLTICALSSLPMIAACGAEAEEETAIESEPIPTSESRAEEPRDRPEVEVHVERRDVVVQAPARPAIVVEAPEPRTVVIERPRRSITLTPPAPPRVEVR